MLNSKTGRSATWDSRRAGSARPRSGDTTLSFTCRFRQAAASLPTCAGSTSVAARMIRSTSPAGWDRSPPLRRSETGRGCSFFNSRCMSANSCALRWIASAGSPFPAIRVSSGGVQLLHSQRAVPRSSTAAPNATAQACTAVVVVRLGAGVSGRISASSPTPPNAHAAIAGSSSIVRCRTERWSRSYRPSTFASSTQSGTIAIPQTPSGDRAGRDERGERRAREVGGGQHPPANGVLPPTRPPRPDAGRGAGPLNRRPICDGRIRLSQPDLRLPPAGPPEDSPVSGIAG